MSLFDTFQQAATEFSAATYHHENGSIEPTSDFKYGFNDASGFRMSSPSPVASNVPGIRR